MSKNQYAVGLLFLFAGVIILLGKLGLFSFIGTNFWPLFILVPGVLLHVLFFGRILPSVVLVPGAILTISSLVFFICMAFGWSNMRYLWPFFIFAAAVGLYEFHLFDMSRPKLPFTIAMILAIAAAVFFFLMVIWGWWVYIVAFGLIGAGAFLVVGRRARW